MFPQSILLVPSFSRMKSGNIDLFLTLIFLILFKSVRLAVWKLEQWGKKCVTVPASLPQSHNGYRVYWEQWLNLWFLFKNWGTSWISNFPIKFVLLRYSRRGEWVLEIILSYMSCRNIIAMFGFMNSIQVRNQIE